MHNNQNQNPDEDNSDDEEDAFNMDVINLATLANLRRTVESM